MAHANLKEQISAETGQASAEIVVTLLGGVLLLASLAAQYLFAPAQAPEPQAHHAEWAGGHGPSNFYAEALAFVAAILLGAPLVLGAWKELVHGHSHMIELVALAFLAAFATGEYLTAGAIAFFMILAELIESRTALGARATIESLIRITPTTARRLEDGRETAVDAKDLKAGDRVRVLPGDNIPGDGVVETGFSTVNQANITGESLPVDKQAGDEVFGGTINLTGALEIKVTKAGEDTTLGQVQQLILQAERTRIPITRLMDRYARWYTPTVLMLAGIVLFFTHNLKDAISMLIIATPCALILAVPTAMVAALSAAARLGILIKKSSDLEVARNLTAIVFDKTGTLTTGTLSVTRLQPAPGVDPAELLAAAALAEQHSRHPVARAVLEVAQRARIPLRETESFEEVSGRGVKARFEGREILVGRASWLKELGLDTAALDSPEAEGLSLLYVARDGKLLGWIGMMDKTRPDAAQAMDRLRELGLKNLVMVTGDRLSVARRVAAEMHCTDLKAEVLPAEKLELVDALKKRGHVVAVVGDGVNDAPALAAGSISIAMGAAGSDVAIHSASIALMNDNLNRIPFLIHLSRRASAVVRQNLIFGGLFIVTFFAIAAAGQLPVVVAAMLHAVAEAVVIFNSARLVREGENLETLAVQAGPRGDLTVPAAQPA
ncbi:MAG: cation-translocating P-type ATPase [Planctomycetota bacterium]|nr:cation-translocating P-type ATPase [Planctomycetota bacterium]